MASYLSPRRPHTGYARGYAVRGAAEPYSAVDQETRAGRTDEPIAGRTRAPGPGELTTRVAELEAALEAARRSESELRTKAEAYLDLLQRTQADFVNYKRRTERERGEDAQQVRADLLAQLLPALDDLERGLGQVPEELRGHAWAEGIPLVARALRLALAKAGVERIGAPGDAFDPRVHEAVACEPHAEFAEGQIADVVRPGYRLGERVIRPAQVTVAGGVR